MSLFIAVPCFGGKVHAGFTQSLLKLCESLKEKNIDHHVSFLEHESLISRGRNTLIAKFYADPKNRLCLFLDSDLLFNPDAVLKMISENKELIGCPYPKKIINWEKVKDYTTLNSWDKLQTEGLNHITDINYNVKPEFDLNKSSVIEALDVPTGFMLIKRSVITALMISYPERQYVNNIAGMEQGLKNYFFDFFGTGVINGIYLSEDYYFCHLVRKLGIKLYLETGFTFGHIGSFTYYGNLALQLYNDKDDKNNRDKVLLRNSICTNTN